MYTYFDPFCVDDFEKILEGGKKEGYALQKLFDSDDFEAISRALLQVGKEIPAEAVEWNGKNVGADIKKLPGNHASRLNTKALVHIFKEIVNNYTIRNLYGFYDWMNAMQSRMAGDSPSLFSTQNF